MRASAVVFAVLAGLCAGPVAAQPRGSDDVLRFARWTVDDIQGIPGALGWRQAGYAAGVGAFVLAFAPHDPAVTDLMIPLNEGIAHTPLRVVEELGNVRAVRPATVLIFAGSLMSGHTRLQDAAFTSMQAVLLADVSSRVLKYVFGRARPYQQLGPEEFAPFSGRTSFPSGHATCAFALVTPWLLYYPNVWTGTLAVLSAGTAFNRIATNVHWFSDVVVGSFIGAAVGYYLTLQHQDQAPRVLVAPSLGDGAGLALQVRF